MKMLKIINSRGLSKFVENDGSAYFFFQNQKKVKDIYQKRDNSSEEVTKVEVYGTKIHLDGTMNNLFETLEFPKKAKVEVDNIINEEKRIEGNILD